jgi:glycosyltransferase involved in cell wall biosynthesis
LKYWLLTTEFPPFFGGGIGTYCAVTAKMLARKGHDVTVFVSDAAVRDIQEDKRDGIRVVRFGTSRTSSSSFLGHTTNISYEFAHVIKHFIEKEGAPDIIEAQEYLGIAYYLLQYKLLLFDWCRDVPVLITMHSPSYLNMEYNHVSIYRYPNFWICEMERFCLQAANYVVSPSQYLLREIKDKFELTNNNIEIIPNPFDATIYGNDLSASEQERADQIVFYGKLTVQKGAFSLLSYFRQLWDKGFDRTLFLLGGQDIVYHAEGMTMGDIIRKKYKKYIDKGLLKLEDRIQPSQIRSRLAKAEVVIIPSKNDNLPYVVFEMMALGKIVLASKQGGQSEVIENGIDGFIFDHEEPGTFFNQLNTILKLGEKDRKDISQRAIKKVKDKYSPEIVYEKKIKLVEKIVQLKNNLPVIFPFVRGRKPESNNWDTNTGIKGRLSIVIPYYNMGQYINDTVQSILQSDHPDKEIVIVNDGSTDSLSVRKLDTYRNQPLIKIIDVENGGLAKARNVGAQQASGEFLAFLDADDTIQPNYYSIAIRVFRQYDNVHFSGCWVRYFESAKGTWPTFNPEPPLILNHNMVNSSSLVYKRDAFRAAGKNDPNMAFQGLEDYESVISLLSHGFGGVVIPEVLFNYRIRPDSMFRAISKTKKLNLYQYISNKHKQFYATFASDIFNLLNANGPGILLDNPTLDYHLADNMPFGRKLSGKIITLVKRNRFIKSIAYKIYKQLKK